MSNRFYKFAFIATGFVLLLLCIYFIKILKIDNADSFTNPLPNKCKPTVSYSFLSVVTPSNVKKTFPHRMFIKSANWWCNETITSTLTYLDSLNPRKPEENEDALILCLTDSLLSVKWNTNNFDSLNSLLEIAEKYLIFSETTPQRKFFFKTVANTWVGFVTNKLSTLVKNENALKYSFKCRYLRIRCSQLGFCPDCGNTSTDKIILNFTEQKWHYLFIERYWYGTSSLFKIITIIPFVFLSLLFLYGCICIFQKHY
jgi:hypothetical protein